MPSWNFTTQKASLKIKQLKYVWITKTLTTFHLRRPKKADTLTTFFLTLVFVWFSTGFMQICFPVYFPKLYPIISYQSSFFFPFGKKIHNFLWQIEHKEWKHIYHSFGNGSDSCSLRRKFYESYPWFWQYFLTSSRIFRRARR